MHIIICKQCVSILTTLGALFDKLLIYHKTLTTQIQSLTNFAVAMNDHETKKPA